jgi:hypothetical protein
MPLAKDISNDIKSDIKAAKKIRLPWWVLLCLGVSSFLMAWLFDHYGKVNLTLPAYNFVVVLGFVIAVKRNLRRHTWFRGTMAILAALHVPLILFVPWTTKWVPALLIAAIDSADLIVMLAILALVEKFMEGSNALEG